MTEDLSSVIEYCTVGNDSFYFDARFGTVIHDSILHSYYKPKASRFNAKKVDAIKHISQEGHLMVLIIMANERLDRITVRFCPSDKSFICREYDPRIIIPAILGDPDIRLFLIRNHHPVGKYGYIANYESLPLITFGLPSNISQTIVGYVPDGSANSRPMTEYTGPTTEYTGPTTECTRPKTPSPFTSSENDASWYRYLTQQNEQPGEAKSIHDEEWYRNYTEEVRRAQVTKRNEEMIDDLRGMSLTRVREPSSSESNTMDPGGADCDSCPDAQQTITEEDRKEIEEMFSNVPENKYRRKSPPRKISGFHVSYESDTPNEMDAIQRIRDAREEAKDHYDLASRNLSFDMRAAQRRAFYMRHHAYQPPYRPPAARNMLEELASKMEPMPPIDKSIIPKIPPAENNLHYVEVDLVTLMANRSPESLEPPKPEPEPVEDTDWQLAPPPPVTTGLIPIKPFKKQVCPFEVLPFTMADITSSLRVYKYNLASSRRFDEM